MKTLITILFLFIAAIVSAQDTAAVAIEWDKNTEPDMKEYRSTFTEFGVENPVPLVITTTDPTVSAPLPKGKFYVLTVVAVNTHLKVSEPSKPFIFLAEESVNVPPPGPPGTPRIKSLSVSIEKTDEALKINIVQK
jgi:hypothetical protein